MTTNTDTPQGHGDEDAIGAPPRPSREAALKAAGKAWDVEETKRAKAEIKGMRPWPKEMKRQDKVLLWMLIGIPAFFMLTMPLRPFFIADHPVALAFATGSYAAIGAASAFASIGEGSLWLVIVAGAVGKAKVSWLFWWAGRRWGMNIVSFMVPSERGRKFARKLETMNPWVMRLLIPLSYLPGVPPALPHIVAGVSGMRLTTLMLLDLFGALMVTSVVAGIGYTSGQAGVDVVLLIDSYALWIMLALIMAMAILPTIPTVRDQRKRKALFLKETGEAYDAETERLASEAAGTAPEAGSGTGTPEAEQNVPDFPEAPLSSNNA